MLSPKQMPATRGTGRAAAQGREDEDMGTERGRQEWLTGDLGVMASLWPLPQEVWEILGAFWVEDGCVLSGRTEPEAGKQGPG